MTVRKTSDSKLRYIAQYDRENTRQVHFKLNVEHDKDILEWLDSMPNRQGYIKELIRADIERNQD